jgi:hypothetical protein
MATIALRQAAHGQPQGVVVPLDGLWYRIELRARPTTSQARRSDVASFWRA